MKNTALVKTLTIDTQAIFAFGPMSSFIWVKTGAIRAKAPVAEANAKPTAYQFVSVPI
jgi:hypothetical protein